MRFIFIPLLCLLLAGCGITADPISGISDRDLVVRKFLADGIYELSGDGTTMVIALQQISPGVYGYQSLELDAPSLGSDSGTVSFLKLSPGRYSMVLTGVDRDVHMLLFAEESGIPQTLRVFMFPEAKDPAVARAWAASYGVETDEEADHFEFSSGRQLRRLFSDPNLNAFMRMGDAMTLRPLDPEQLTAFDWYDFEFAFGDEPPVIARDERGMFDIMDSIL